MIRMNQSEELTKTKKKRKNEKDIREKKRERPETNMRAMTNGTKGQVTKESDHRSKG